MPQTIEVGSQKGFSMRPTVTAKFLLVFPAELVFQERAVDPDLILAEVSALPVVRQTEGLVFGDRTVVLAAADPQADGKAIVPG
ncbi:MAG: hypothetical protein WDN28_33285 [Chthoniobacter sp.]